MKILVIAPDYLPRTGGVEKHILMVTRELVHQGHEVVVLVRHGDYLPEHQTVEGVQVWRLPSSNSLPALLKWYLGHRHVFRDVDVIHSHDFYPRHLRKLLPGVKWVHTFHGYEGYPLDPAAIASRQGVRREVDVCFGVGAFIEKWYGTKLDYTIYGAVDPMPISKTPAAATDILFLGRLEEDTGFEVYLRAFELIHKKHPQVTLGVVGGGLMHDWAKDFIAERKLPVTLFGWMPDPSAYIQASKVMFAPGYLVILEAALAGKPIVSHYGTPIKKDYLELHPLAEYMGIGGSVEQIADSYDKTGLMSGARLKQAQAWAGEQTWARLVGMYVDAYK
jgi:glycosyltransferase involved in cell wall biosynthesis